MFSQQGLQNERVLDCVLHTAGALGLAVIACMAYWLMAAGTPESAPPHPGSGPEIHATRLRAVHAELDELDRQLKAVEARLGEVSRRVPAEPRESEFLNDLRRVASEASLTIRDYKPAPPITQAGCHQMFIRLSGSGDYRSICRFLDGVSRLPRLTTVETLEITADSAAAAYPIAVTVAVYFTDQAAAGGKMGVGKNG